MDIATAQADLRRAYVGGGPGAVVSGLVWAAAAVGQSTQGTATAFTVLFIGGIAIFPLGTLIARLIFGRAKENAANPLGLLALESTIAMLGCLLAAWLFLRFEPEFVFPIAAIAVGTHYFAFKTAYGDRLYWLLAALVTAVGLLDLFDVVALPGGVIVSVAVIEIVFGVVLTLRALRATG